MVDRFELLAVDVDGTLVTSDNRLCEANRSALHEAHEAGMTVCLCTGRALNETRAVIEQIGLDLDAGVFVFGAIVSRLPEGRTLVRTTLSEPLATRLVRSFQAQDYPVLALYDPTTAGIDYRFVDGERNRDWCERWLEMARARVERIDDWEPIDSEPVRLGVIAQPDQIDETVAALKRDFTPEEVKFNAIHAPNYGLHVVECFAPAVNKWYGLTRLADQLGIDPSRIAAIGDDINDLEMIRQAGLGIAMGNAIEPIKGVADWQAPPHDQAGVAAAVAHVLARGSDG